MRTLPASSAMSDLDCICRFVLYDEACKLLDGMKSVFA